MAINFKEFANEIIDISRESDIDGADVQDLAVKWGLLVEEMVNEPCDGDCVCAEYGAFPVSCYRKAYV